MKRALYDENLNEFRNFDIVPPDVNWKPKCMRGLHQFDASFYKCDCGKYLYKS